MGTLGVTRVPFGFNMNADRVKEHAASMGRGAGPLAAGCLLDAVGTVRTVNLVSTDSNGIRFLEERESDHIDRRVQTHAPSLSGLQDPKEHCRFGEQVSPSTYGISCGENSVPGSHDGRFGSDGQLDNPGGYHDQLDPFETERG